MTEVLTPKAPADTVAVRVDWRQQLTSAPGVAPDVISSFTLTVTSGTVSIADSENLGLAISATVAGGVDGETAVLSCQVVTYGGQTLTRELSLWVSTTANTATPETTTKRQVIGMALEELGLADYEFNTSNEEKASALRRLDSLMALWAGTGFNLHLSYNFPHAIGGSNLSDAAGIPDDALDAVSTHLAAKLAPVIGKSLSPETRTSLNRSLNALRAQYAVIPERRVPRGTIVGAGQKPRSVWQPFFGDVSSSGAASASSSTPPTALYINGTPNPTVTAGAFYNFTPSGGGGSGALTYLIVNKPAWATFSSVTGQLSGIPGAAEVDSNVQIGVSDSLGVQAWLLPFTITVSAAASSPSLDFSQADNSQYVPLL